MKESRNESPTLEMNLAVCPRGILALDANAETLWRVLLRKLGITVKGGAHIEDRRAWILRNFGVPDLGNRLAVQQLVEKGGVQDDVARAIIWRHVCEASSAGEIIADINSQNRYVLNPFIVPKNKKFPSPLDALKQSPGALPLCANEKCPHGPNGSRAAVPSPRAKYCSKSCRNVVSRRDGYIAAVRTHKTTSRKAA
jgi:hypothetical protein